MALRHKARVVITGVGVVAPNGIGKAAFWKSLLAAESGISNITLFDASKHPCNIAGEVKGFDLSAYADTSFLKVHRLSRQTQLALAATVLALRDAGLDDRGPSSANPLWLVLGISSSAIEVITHGYDFLLSRGPHRVPPHIVQGCQPQQTASVIAEYLRCPTSTQTISTACAAGIEALSVAKDRIMEGVAEVVIAGGADAPVNSLTFACLARAGLIANSSYPPEKAGRPFDIHHTVGVISEAAGMLVLENRDHAINRNAHIYAEITGSANFMDSDFSVPGSGYSCCMRTALNNAGRMPSDIDMISAHGPGHMFLDRQETKSIREVFDRHAAKLVVQSIKGVTGNPLAAAGALQTITSALTLTEGVIPPTTNCDHPDPQCDLDYVQHKPRKSAIRKILINAHGLGSGNSAIILESANSE